MCCERWWCARIFIVIHKKSERPTFFSLLFRFVSFVIHIWEKSQISLGMFRVHMHTYLCEFQRETQGKSKRRSERSAKWQLVCTKERERERTIAEERDILYALLSTHIIALGMVSSCMCLCFCLCRVLASTKKRTKRAHTQYVSYGSVHDIICV